MHPFSSGSFTTRDVTSPIRLPILARVLATELPLRWMRLTREFYDTVSLPPLARPRKLYLNHPSSREKTFERRDAGCRNGSKTRIDRERKENECMTPAYCARSNDIRDIIPASRECLLTLDVVLEILSSYCTLSSNTVLIKLVKGEPRPLLRPLDDVYTFSSHSLREIVAVSLLFFPSMKPAIDGALSYVFVGEPRTDCHGRVRLQRR